jgi:hypothetical protein
MGNSLLHRWRAGENATVQAIAGAPRGRSHKPPL